MSFDNAESLGVPWCLVSIDAVSFVAAQQQQLLQPHQQRSWTPGSGHAEESISSSPSFKP